MKYYNEVITNLKFLPLLDETDPGLDVDALRIVANAINEMKSDNFGCIMVSHYERLFNECNRLMFMC